MNVPTKVLIAAFGLASTYVGWRVWANETGYCLLTNSFNSPETILALGIQNELQYMSAFKIDLRGKSIAENVEEGPPLSWDGAGLAYDSLEEFNIHNQGCCKLNPRDDFGYIENGIFSYISGWPHGLSITWRMPYFDEKGEKHYRGELARSQPGLLGMMESSMTEKRFSVLLVSNCGFTKEARWGNWWGRE